jgi:hypothetical protein
MENHTELKLWCVECSPVNKRDDKVTKHLLTLLLRGPGDGTPEDPDAQKAMRALTWTALAMTGIADQRKPQYEEVRRKLAIFRTEGAAKKYAQKHNTKNDHWIARAKPVRIMSDDDFQ